MPSYRVSGDLLHAFVIEVQADSLDEAIAKVENGDIYIDEFDTSSPGFRVDGAVELDEDGNEIEE